MRMTTSRSKRIDKLKILRETVYQNLRKQIRELKTEVADYEAIFNLRWDADMRAIRMWHEKTGYIMTWPDHADLCVWLMDQLEKKQCSTKKRGRACS